MQFVAICSLIFTHLDFWPHFLLSYALTITMWPIPLQIQTFSFICCLALLLLCLLVCPSGTLLSYQRIETQNNGSCTSHYLSMSSSTYDVLIRFPSIFNKGQVTLKIKGKKKEENTHFPWFIHI